MEVTRAEDYFEALLRAVPKAKKRIVIAAMIVLWGERTAPIFIMLQDALKRGVKVTILLDIYTGTPAAYGLQPRATRSARVKQTFQALEDLGKLGAHVYRYGKVGIVPFKGRCHVKATIIDDISYSFGGVNFSDDAFTLADYMLRTTDPKIADSLAKLVRHIGTTPPPLDNQHIKLSEGQQLLFDGGQRGTSLIYERACELAAQSKRAHYVSQMVPSGQLAHLLQECNGSIYSNRPEQMDPFSSLGQAFDGQKYRILNKYKGNHYIHAKYILFELRSGAKVLLSGSHNFSYRGVSFGTQEIALQSTDPKLWEALHTFLKTRIASQKS
jgi:cardiolipin synthase